MSRNSGPFNLNDTYARLRPDASASPISVDATFWQDLSAGTYGSFANEFLVTTQSFVQNWPIWEMHPQGEEMVILLTGAIDLVLEKANGNKFVSLQKQGDWLMVPKGVWHTARVLAPSTVLFITAGEGTLHRQVDL
jgi:mannose-6-phosphate isomerase-like protein (cupin superfamily)